MANFQWKGQNDSGCVLCGSPVHPNGFVDCISDTLVRGQSGEVVGVVDIVICAMCLEQAARYVGCASRLEVEEFAYREVELIEQLTKAKDEAHAERQKHEDFIDGIYAFQRAEAEKSFDS